MNWTTLLRIGRHAAIGATLVVGPAFWLALLPVWRLDSRYLLILAGSVAAYLLAVGSLSRGGTWGDKPSAIAVLAHFAGWFGLWLLGVVLWESGLFGTPLPQYNRTALLAGLTVGLLGLLLVARSKPTSWVALLVIGAAGATAVAGQGAYYWRYLPRMTPQVLVSHLESGIYPLKLTEYINYFRNPVSGRVEGRNGGGMAAWGKDYLRVSGDGYLFVFNEDRTTGTLRVRNLPYRVPFNPAEFVTGATAVLKDIPGSTTVTFNRFRTTDVMVQDIGDKRRILVSHHYWDSTNACFWLRLSAIEGTPAQFMAGDPSLHWRTVYNAQPCMKINDLPNAAYRFDGHEGGGRMAALGPDDILLAVGFTGFDGVKIPLSVSQDPAMHWGKILRVDLATGTGQVFTSGHRNPQGLHITPSGEIWATEHGPRGGDELNRIIEGRDYGWPTVTYGTHYSAWTWPFNPQQGRHEEFERPIYAFVPSVGISALTSVESGLFPLWSNDLLISSLKSETVFRTHMRDGRAIVVEPMLVGRRIRDLMFGNDGRLVLGTDSHSIIFLEPIGADSTEALAAQCMGCHVMDPGQSSSTLGPNLAGIVNRRIAARDDFNYSVALRQLEGAWTTERLDAFLADPQAFAMGTTMAMPAIPDPVQRRKLIEYLESAN